MAAKNRAMLAQQQAVNNRIQALQDRYTALQKQESDLLLQIGEAKQTRAGGTGMVSIKATVRTRKNPYVPLLQSQLSDVRHEKGEVRKQLEKAQR